MVKWVFTIKFFEIFCMFGYLHNKILGKKEYLKSSKKNLLDIKNIIEQ
jgi:hypothetical protein